MNWGLIAFAALAAIAVLAAYRVVVSPAITHAALYLALVLVSIAGLFVLLNAEFLAAVQVLVYAGAVLAVVVFAIMLSEQREIGAGGRQAGRLAALREALISPYWGPLPVVVAGVLAVLVLTAVGRMAAPVPTAPEVEDTVRAVGQALFGPYMLPFEIASAVLLVAMIGAIALAREEEGQG